MLRYFDLKFMLFFFSVSVNILICNSKFSIILTTVNFFTSQFIFPKLFQNDFVVDTSLVGVVMNGLSHFYQVRSKTHFAVCLMRGLGGNLVESAREAFAKEVKFQLYHYKI